MDTPPVWMFEWLAENGHRAERATGLRITSRIESPLGCGSYGCVYKTEDPRWVLKVTDDPDEGPLMASIIALRKKYGGDTGYGPNTYLPGVVFVRNIFQAWWDVNEPIYVIVREEVKPWGSWDWHRMVYYDATKSGDKMAAYPRPAPEGEGMTAMTIVQEYAKLFNRVTSIKGKEQALLKYVEWLGIASEELPLVAESMLELFDHEIVLEDVHEANLGYARSNWGPEYRRPGRVVIHDVGMSETPIKTRFLRLNPVGDASFGIGMYPWLPLDQSLAWEPLAAELGVSKIARSKSGFMRAYEAAVTPDGIDPYWANKRERFITRHVAQAKANREPWFRGGAPTRRHLALIMWGYSPEPSKLHKARPPRHPNPLPSQPDPDEVGFYAEGACELLAYALAKRFGYTPVALRYYFGNGDWTTPHVFAKQGDVAIDAGGPTQVEEILSREWHIPPGDVDPKLVILSPEAALDELRSWSKDDVQEALDYVDRYSDFYDVRGGTRLLDNPVAREPRKAPSWLRFALEKSEATAVKMHGRMLLPKSWDIYGCGGFGCVLPTRDSRWVCKVAIEGSEAFFARAQGKLDLYPPGIAQYLEPVRVETRTGPLWVMWRQAIDDGGPNFDEWCYEDKKLPPELKARVHDMEWNNDDGAEMIRKFDEAKKLREDWARERGTDAYDILHELQQMGLRVAAMFTWFCENVDDRPSVFAQMLADRKEAAEAIFKPEYDGMNWHYTETEGLWEDRLLNATVGLLGYRFHLRRLQGHKLMGPLAAGLKAYLDKGILLGDAQPDNIAKIDGVWSLYDAGFAVPIASRWNAMWIDEDVHVDRWFGNERFELWHQLADLSSAPGYLPNPG